jgi:hypothetical protein
MLEFAQSAGSPPNRLRLLNKQEPDENQANQHSSGIGSDIASFSENDFGGSHRTPLADTR